MVLKYNKGLMLLQILFCIIQGVGPAISLYVWNKIVAFSVGINNDKTLLYLIVLAVVYASLYLMDIISNFISRKMVQKTVKVKQSFMRDIFVALYDIPLDVLETSDFQERLSFCSRIISYNTMIRIVALFFNIPARIIALASVNILILWDSNPMFVIIGIISVLPSVVYRYVTIKENIQISEELNESKREVGYLQGLLMGGDLEIKCYGASDLLLDRWENINRKILEKEFRNDIRVLIKQFLLENIETLGYIFGIIIGVIGLMKQTISISVFIVLLSAVTVMQQALKSFLSELSELSKHKLGFERLFDIIDYPKENIGTEKIETIESIEFRHVSYKYPNSEFYAINDVNLTINKKDNIVIVGENGSGKSTFVKLLLGLYVPTKGEIIINGKYNLNNIDKWSYRDQFSATFQDYNKYALTISDNVAISKCCEKKDDCLIKNILIRMGFDSEDNCIPEFLDQILSKAFGGTELSGGEWQKIALARCLYRDKEFFVFDEPTSAIDPIQENNIYTEIGEISRGKTSCVISHRIGITKLASRILVFEKGCVIGDGSHFDLMQRNNKYLNLYNNQAQWYNE